MVSASAADGAVTSVTVCVMRERTPLPRKVIERLPDIKRQQPLNHGIRIGEVVLKHGDVSSITQHRPIGALKRRILVIVQNSDLAVRHGYPFRAAYYFYS